MHPTRRQVIQGSIGVAGAAALTSLLPIARASSTEPTDPHRRFVFVYFLGGWDAILTLDPKDPEVYDDTEATILSTGVQTAYTQVGARIDDPRIFTDVEGLVLGPYMGELLPTLASKLAVIRGMTVTSVDHIAGALHAVTGRAPAGLLPRGSSLATILAAALGENELIPNLVSGIQSYNLDQPNYASALEAVSYQDLQQILAPGLTVLEPAERDALETFFAKETERMANPRLSTMLETRLSSQALVEEQIAEVFNPANADNIELAEYFSGHAGAFMAYQALTQGISRCMTYRGCPFNDTHSGAQWRTLHGPRLQDGFDSVALLAQRLDDTEHPAGGSWLDHTTIVCASEFNRSPALNGVGGRDHATNNSMLLLGAGIKGGTVIGASHPIRMAAQKVDLSTGEVDPDGGSSIEHDNVGRTLLASIGITEDIADLRAEPIPALMA